MLLCFLSRLLLCFLVYFPLGFASQVSHSYPDARVRRVAVTFVAGCGLAEPLSLAFPGVFYFLATSQTNKQGEKRKSKPEKLECSVVENRRYLQRCREEEFHGDAINSLRDGRFQPGMSLCNKKVGGVDPAWHVIATCPELRSERDELNEDMQKRGERERTEGIDGR